MYKYYNKNTLFYSAPVSSHTHIFKVLMSPVSIVLFFLLACQVPMDNTYLSKTHTQLLH